MSQFNVNSAPAIPLSMQHVQYAPRQPLSAVALNQYPSSTQPRKQPNEAMDASGLTQADVDLLDSVLPNAPLPPTVQQVRSAGQQFAAPPPMQQFAPPIFPPQRPNDYLSGSAAPAAFPMAYHRPGLPPSFPTTRPLSPPSVTSFEAPSRNVQENTAQTWADRQTVALQTLRSVYDQPLPSETNQPQYIAPTRFFPPPSQPAVRERPRAAQQTNVHHQPQDERQTLGLLTPRSSSNVQATAHSAPTSTGTTAKKVRTPKITEVFDPNAGIYDDCNMVRRKIRAYLADGNKVTHFLSDICVNSNSYRRFMGYSGADAGQENGTYSAAYYFFEMKRIEEGKPKSKGRLANEEAWGIAGHSTDRERKFVRVYTGPRR